MHAPSVCKAGCPGGGCISWIRGRRENASDSVEDARGRSMDPTTTESAHDVRQKRVIQPLKEQAGKYSPQ